MIEHYEQPPEELREVLGPRGWEYIRDLHEKLVGIGVDGNGSLDGRNMSVSADDDGSVVFLNPDKTLAARIPNVSEFKANDGVLQGVDGKVSSGPLDAEGLSTTVTTPRKTLKTNGVGLALASDLETRVAGAANLSSQTAHPEAGSPDSEVTSYLNDSFVVYQYNHTKDDGTLETRYKSLDLLSDGGSFAVTVDEPPSRDDDGGGGGSGSVAGVAAALDLAQLEVFA